MADSVSILLAAGIGLALMYGVVYFTAPSNASGAFVSGAGAGSVIFALVVIVLAAVGLWQSKAYRKM